ncbi:MAG: histidine kinase, partial [Bacteroidota bacterium]
ILLVLVLKVQTPSTAGAFTAALFSMISHALLVYLHLLILVPLFFERKAYLAYALCLLFCLLGISYFRVGTMWSITITVLPWMQEVIQPRFSMALLFNGVFVLFVSLPLYLVRNSLKKEALEVELKNQQLEAELRFLRAQVNPHFLFNTLNNIYSLAFVQSEKTPEMILRLSDMMSYMLYDCKEEKVKLSTEINYLNNYLSLQQLKKDGTYNIQFEVEDTFDDVFVSPLLFVPFFENGFKHGNLDNTQSGWLKSKFCRFTKAGIYFEISNSVGNPTKIKQKGGVGLQNIKERLALLYPEQHELNIQQTTDSYTVQLKLQIQ